MNYIKHLNGAFQHFYADDRMHPGHIGLYMALFFYWNLHHFPAEFYVNRTELMKMAKIGSRSTYHRLIKQLSEWGYITYIPTQNPTQKTVVSMSHLCTDSGTDMEGNGTLLERYCPINVPLTLYIKHTNNIKRSKKGKPKNESEVISFFKAKNWPLVSAKKFFEHYQGTGLKIEGKAVIEDWKAIAENWMMRSNLEKKNFKEPNPWDSRDHLKTQHHKNYGQPL